MSINKLAFSVTLIFLPLIVNACNVKCLVPFTLYLFSFLSFFSIN